MKTFFAFAILFSLSTGVVSQAAPNAPKPPIKLNHKPNAVVAYRLEFQVAEQIFFVNSIGGNFLLDVSHTSPDGERAFTIQGEFLPGAGAEVGMLDFEAKLMESNLDDGVNGEYNSKGSTTVKKDQSQQLATLGHHVLSLTVKDVQEKK